MKEQTEVGPAGALFADARSGRPTGKGFYANGKTIQTEKAHPGI